MKAKVAAVSATLMSIMAISAVTAAPASAAISDVCARTSREPTLSIGSSDSVAVKQAQCQLTISMSGDNLVIDGIFGSNTYKAVKRFQYCAGLSVDGIIGPNTWSKLDYWTTAPRYICYLDL